MSQLHCIYSSNLPLTEYRLLQPSLTRNHTQQYLSIDKLNILKTQKLHMIQTNNIRQLSSYSLTDTHDLKPPSQLLVECQQTKTGGNAIRRPTPRNRYETQQHNQSYHHQGRCKDKILNKNKVNKGFRGSQKKIDLKNEVKSSRKEVLRYRPKEQWDMNEKQKQDTLMDQNSIELQLEKQNENMQQTNSTHCQYASIKQKSTSANIPQNYNTDPNSIQTQSQSQAGPEQPQTQTILKIPILLEFSFYHNIYAITIVSISSYFIQVGTLLCNLRQIVRQLEHVDSSQGRNRWNEKGKLMLEELEEWRYTENALRVVVLSKICQQLNKNKQVMGREQKDLIVKFQKMLDSQIKLYCQSKLKRHKIC